MSLTAGATLRRGWLGRRSLIAALVISLALNLCFVAGGLWTRYHPAAGMAIGAERFRLLAEEMKLTPEQRQTFGKYVAVLRVRSERMHGEVEPLLASAWVEMGKDHPDQVQVDKLIEEVSKKRLAYQREVLAQTIALLATFSPEQREKFIANVLERHAATPRHFPATR